MVRGSGDAGGRDMSCDGGDWLRPLLQVLAVGFGSSVRPAAVNGCGFYPFCLHTTLTLCKLSFFS